ncbi:hypothetical protein UCD39_06615 [Nitrospirillum sp. BR 11752]|uniref:hypothetical protein n=1 Tax=Nitrospirillum sp. BR 11752 TaxID=3104293 RepID=UPI002EB22AC6|nr:hypothetical protein [Nitrospirillum sp. BR 11752]
MRCLWITLADPDPPHNGQFIYSGGLIGSLAQAGADMAVLGLSRPDGKRADGARETPGDGAIDWHLAEHKPRSRWSSLRSPCPTSRTAAARRTCMPGCGACWPRARGTAW